jgi:hypothetical protein
VAGLDFCCRIDSHHIGVSDYRLQFNELINGLDASHFLHVLVNHRMNRHYRYTAVGCFTSEVEHIKALQRLKSDNNTKLSFRHWGLESICSSVIGIAFREQYSNNTIKSTIAQP